RERRCARRRGSGSAVRAVRAAVLPRRAPGRRREPPRPRSAFDADRGANRRAELPAAWDESWPFVGSSWNRARADASRAWLFSSWRAAHRGATILRPMISEATRALIRKRLADETGRLDKDAPFRVALAYPSPYRVG